MCVFIGFTERLEEIHIDLEQMISQGVATQRNNLLHANAWLDNGINNKTDSITRSGPALALQLRN